MSIRQGTLAVGDQFNNAERRRSSSRPEMGSAQTCQMRIMATITWIENAFIVYILAHLPLKMTQRRRHGEMEAPRPVLMHRTEVI